MKRPHLLHVEAPANAFEPLIAAAHEAGLRLGWLRLDAASALPGPLPEELHDAAGAGVLRAVHCSAAGTATVKPRRGAPVVQDLLREHFRGCAAVLVAGDLAAVSGRTVVPVVGHLSPGSQQLDEPGADARGNWRLRLATGHEQTYATAELVAVLRKPHPWG